jgi:hypothetical protein
VVFIRAGLDLQVAVTIAIGAWMPHSRGVASMTRSPQANRRRGGSTAPMSQNSGKKIPMMNITQCPLRIESTPSVIIKTT